MKGGRVVVHTDIFVSHLVARTDAPTVLRAALRKYFCYTTVFNAMQLFAMARTAKERAAVEKVLSAVKILGVNGRNAKKFSGLDGFTGRSVPAAGMIAGICAEARLPLLTGRGTEFRKYPAVRIMAASRLVRTA